MTTMARFFIGHDLNGIEKVTQDSGELALLARGGGTVMIQNKLGPILSIYPSDQSDVMEFFVLR